MKMRAHHAKSRAYGELLTDLRKCTLHTYYALNDLSDDSHPSTEQAYALSRMTIGDLENIPPAKLKSMHGLSYYVNEYRTNEAFISTDGKASVYDWARNNILLLPCIAWNGKTPDYTRKYSKAGLLRMWSNIYHRLERNYHERRGIPENAEEKSISDEELHDKMKEYHQNLAEHMFGKPLGITERSRQDLPNCGDRRDLTLSSDLEGLVIRLTEVCLELLRARRGE